jgi:hypothetical protein
MDFLCLGPGILATTACTVRIAEYMLPKAPWAGILARSLYGVNKRDVLYVDVTLLMQLLSYPARRAQGHKTRVNLYKGIVSSHISHHMAWEGLTLVSLSSPHGLWVCRLQNKFHAMRMQQLYQISFVIRWKMGPQMLAFTLSLSLARDIALSPPPPPCGKNHTLSYHILQLRLATVT